jgi:hypothetical protein
VKPLQQGSLSEHLRPGHWSAPESTEPLDEDDDAEPLEDDVEEVAPDELDDEPAGAGAGSGSLEHATIETTIAAMAGKTRMVTQRTPHRFTFFEFDLDRHSDSLYMNLMMTATTKPLSKTATKREAARLQREISAKQQQLTALRSHADGGGGYGVGRDGQPTVCQRLVDEMTALGGELRALLGVAA